MSAAKHTPGVLRAAEKIADWDYYGNPKAVADIISCETAAPDMLDALKLAVAAFSGVRANDAEAAGFDLAKAREIIARAEGKA